MMIFTFDFTFSKPNNGLLASPTLVADLQDLLLLIQNLCILNSLVQHFYKQFEPLIGLNQIQFLIIHWLYFVQSAMRHPARF